MASSHQNQAVLDALSDVVTTVPSSTDGSTTSLSSAPPPPPKSQGSAGMASRFAGAFRRGDKEAKRKEKEARMRNEIDKSTAKVSRMDIIDRLDLSGIHGSSMFHHDSPYDAVSPHRNRNSTKAPVMAFDPNVDPMTGKPIGAARPSANKALSPLAAATLQRMEESGHAGVGSGGVDRPLPPRAYDQDATLSQASFATENSSNSRGGNDIAADHYWNQPSEIPSSRQDVSNPHAEMWGITSEPWQDFASPAARPNRNTPGGSKVDVSGTASETSSVFDMEAVLTGKTSSSKPKTDTDTSDLAAIGSVSPFPERDWGNEGASGSGSGNDIKRSKSLIKRIKTARQNPNVPLGPEDNVEMGVVGRRGGRGPSHRHSPSSPPLNTHVATAPYLLQRNNSSNPSIPYKDDQDGETPTGYNQPSAPWNEDVPQSLYPFSGGDAQQEAGDRERVGRSSNRPEMRGSQSAGNVHNQRSGSLFRRFSKKNGGSKEALRAR